MIPVVKGAGSVIAGINKMLELDIVVTSRSVNLINELDNYCWSKDKDGRLINEPIDKYNHLIDAARYFVLSRVLGWGDGSEVNVSGVF